jgi:RHS repeat-associated protein
MISSCVDHTTAGTGYTNFKILTKKIFDKLGRVTSLQKQFGTNAFKTVASYEYDDIGRVKNKGLDPGYTAGGNPGLETLQYSYNLHNNITGINKDYALKTPGNYNKWGHFFGLYVGYDNRDNVFAGANLNGQVTGLLWNTQGDDAQRKYNYTYDNTGRLTNAAFAEQLHPGDGWSSSQMDFSVTGDSGRIRYDLNGNLLNMLQKGVLPGNATPLTIDNLTYTYYNYSNKLKIVTDGMTNTAVNGQFGDLKDGANAVGTADYVYDNNGNLVIDLNKNLQSVNGGAPGTNGIIYNYLDKPESIRLVGKGTIRLVYSADGEKLQRTFIPEAGGNSVITTYIKSFTYEESAAITTTTVPPLGGVPALSTIGFEEGRIRVITPVSQNNGLDALTIDGNMDLPGGKKGAYDYYITDYQENVRMILTEEIHNASNTATMETTRSVLEESIFGQAGVNNEVATTRHPKPSGWQNGSVGNSVSRVGTISGRNIGPNTLQKVMAGDKISATVQYYYETPASGNNTSFVSTMLASLLPSISGGSATTQVVKNNASAITTQLGGVTGFVNAVQPGGSNPPGTTPQAYLTVLFFDERFKFVAAADGGVVQQQVSSSVGSGGAALALANIPAPKNGYAYVYVSNQSNQDVYFDNLQVGKAGGNIIEENHYYAYGLKITAISSRKLGDVNEGGLDNNYQYNGKELFDEGDLNWYDYGFRNYDPQIGRFPQLDPLTDQYTILTPYQYASCDPITNIDIDGLEGGIATTAATAKVLTEVVVTAVRRTMQLAPTVAGLSGTVSLTIISLQLAVTTVNILNGTMQTVSVTEVLTYGTNNSAKFRSLMTTTGITTANHASHITVHPSVTQPATQDKKIYLPTIPNVAQGVIWLAHEMSNLAKHNEFYAADKKFSEQVVARMKNPKAKLMTPDEYASEKINLEARSIEDRIIVAAEANLVAPTQKEQKVVDEYKKTKSLQKLREGAKKLAEESKAIDPDDATKEIPIRDFWKKMYPRVKAEIERRNPLPAKPPVKPPAKKTPAAAKPKTKSG